MSALPLLFADRGCPYAHRVLALLDHLGVAADLRESAVGDRPPGMSRYASSGRIPLLVHGELVITESRVMLEHLAEHYAFADAYPPALAARTLHRHAMAVTDDFVAALLFRAPADADHARLDDALDALQRATAAVPPRPCLLTVHLAPVWLRFRWWRPQGAVTRAVEARAGLCNWLDASVRLECVARTAPERAAHVADFARTVAS